MTLIVIILQTRGLHFRHTDNINFFMNGCSKVGLPKARIFFFVAISDWEFILLELSRCITQIYFFLRMYLNHL